MPGFLDPSYGRPRIERSRQAPGGRESTANAELYGGGESAGRPAEAARVSAQTNTDFPSPPAIADLGNGPRSFIFFRLSTTRPSGFSRAIRLRTLADYRRPDPKRPLPLPSQAAGPLI